MTQESLPHAGSTEGGRLLRLAVSCPGCGTRPALRFTEELVRTLREPGSARIGTYQCQQRGCGAIYDLFPHDCFRR
jgi:hypothetical protein